MGNTPYGLSALMETINNLEAEEKNLDVLNDIAAGTTESFNYIDALEAGLMDDDDEGEYDDGMEDVEDEVDENDPELNRMIDAIDEDEEEPDLENLDYALESYIQNHDN